MDAKEWATEAFERCDHAGMICLHCAEQVITAAVAEERARLLNGDHAPDRDERLAHETVSRRFAASKKF